MMGSTAQGGAQGGTRMNLRFGGARTDATVLVKGELIPKVHKSGGRVHDCS